MKKMEKEKKCPSSEGHLFWEGGRLCFCTFPYRSALCSFHRDWLLTECGHLEIFVKVIYQETNQTITLAVDPDDSIANLKSIINAKKGFPVDEQRIVYNGRKLRDDRTVSDYNIPNKSTLNLVLRVPGRHNGHNRMEVTILTEARGPVATYTLAVRPTDSILEVKLKIRDMTGVPPQKQILNFADRELENTRIISDYNIRNDSVIYLVEKIEVCLVFSSTQERMALELSPKDTVESVKEKIHAKTKISPYRQILQFNGEHLDDVHSLNYYNIENKSMLFLYLAVEIFVKMSTGIDVRFKLIKSNTIKNLKERIQLSQDIPCDMQRLYFLRRLLEDKYALSDYSIKNGSVLDCNVLLISVNVKMPNKDDISVDVCPEDKVRIVIDKIQAREAIPPDHQCLMYNGIKLAHCRTLRDYQIRNGSILNLVKSGGTSIYVLRNISSMIDTVFLYKIKHGEENWQYDLQQSIFEDRTLRCLTVL